MTDETQRSADIRHVVEAAGKLGESAGRVFREDAVKVLEAQRTPIHWPEAPRLKEEFRAVPIHRGERI